MFEKGDIVRWKKFVTLSHLKDVSITGTHAARLLNAKTLEIYKTSSETGHSFVIFDELDWYVNTEWLELDWGEMDDTRAYLEAVASYV